MSQRFYANRTKPMRVWNNGAKGYGYYSSFDCVGPFAAVEGCPVADTSLRRTVYATNYADSYFSIPACTKIGGRHVTGFMLLDDNGPNFVAYDSDMNGAAIEKAEQAALINIIKLARKGSPVAEYMLAKQSAIHSQHHYRIERPYRPISETADDFLRAGV